MTPRPDAQEAAPVTYGPLTQEQAALIAAEGDRRPDGPPPPRRLFPDDDAGVGVDGDSSNGSGDDDDDDGDGVGVGAVGVNSERRGPPYGPSDFRNDRAADMYGRVVGHGEDIEGLDNMSEYGDPEIVDIPRELEGGNKYKKRIKTKRNKKVNKKLTKKQKKSSKKQTKRKYKKKQKATKKNISKK